MELRVEDLGGLRRGPSKFWGLGFRFRIWVLDEGPQVLDHFRGSGSGFRVQANCLWNEILRCVPVCCSYTSTLNPKPWKWGHFSKEKQRQVLNKTQTGRRCNAMQQVRRQYTATHCHALQHTHVSTGTPWSLTTFPLLAYHRYARFLICSFRE